jgi:hypothetical protein
MLTTYTSTFTVIADKANSFEEFVSHDEARVAAEKLAATEDVTINEYIIRDGTVMWLGPTDFFEARCYIR